MRSRQVLWRWRRSPLQRRSDRVERTIRLIAAVLLLVVVPAAGVLGAMVVHGRLLALARQQSTERQVSAVLLENAQCTADGISGLSCNVRASWVGPDGSQHTAVVKVAEAATKGSVEQIWTDSRGALADPPLTAAQVRGNAVVTGVGTGLSAGAVVVLGGWVALALLDRKRYRQWEQEWAAIEPLWNRHTI